MIVGGGLRFVASASAASCTLANGDSLAVVGGSGGTRHGGEPTNVQSFDALDVRRVTTTLAPPTIDDFARHDTWAGGARWHSAFERYRAAKLPKAFAVSDEGDWASASGHANAATQALVECARKGRRCHLFAVDDRLITGPLR